MTTTEIEGGIAQTRSGRTELSARRMKDGLIFVLAEELGDNPGAAGVTLFLEPWEFQRLIETFQKVLDAPKSAKKADVKS